MKKTKIIFATIAVVMLLNVLTVCGAVSANASTIEPQVIITPYEDLWKSPIEVEAGTPVEWYVSVPEGTTLKGCGATVKIPGYEAWTDDFDNTQNHIVLAEGNNLIYQFDALEPGDILFTCWMGSGCHKNYIHVEKKSATVPTEESSEQTVESSVQPIEESSAESIEESSEQTVESSVQPIEESSAESIEESSDNDVQVIVTKFENLWTGNISVQVGKQVEWYVDVPEGTDVYSGMGANKELGRVSCCYSVKIPELGLGTENFVAEGEEGQINLAPGRNLIVKFTPEQTGDILFCCWMGADCHSNYIHVTENGPISDGNDSNSDNQDSHEQDDVLNESSVVSEVSDNSESSESDNDDTTGTTNDNENITTDSNSGSSADGSTVSLPQTGDHTFAVVWIFAAITAAAVIFSVKRKKNKI